MTKILAKLLVLATVVDAEKVRQIDVWQAESNNIHIQSNVGRPPSSTPTRL
jgi:hypothetical protein